MHQYPEELVDVFSERLNIDIREIPTEVSSQGLMPWELACCWIDEDGAASIRVRPPDDTKRVHRNVILAHELIHAFRGSLFSCRFEEFTAYAVCRELFPQGISWWRVALGPLFSSVKEVYCVFALIWVNSVLPFFVDIPLLVSLAIPCVACFYFVMRLSLRWRVWNRVFEKLRAECPDVALAMIVRLTDKDLITLAKRSGNRLPFCEKERQEIRGLCKSSVYAIICSE